MAAIRPGMVVRHPETGSCLWLIPNKTVGSDKLETLQTDYNAEDLIPAMYLHGGGYLYRLSAAKCTPVGIFVMET